MAADLVTTAYGPPALDALASRIGSAKGGDPLAPVTVVVPGNAAGVAARRALAARPVVGDRPGIAGVDFVTVHRLAEALGGPALVAAGRRPVSTAVLAAAARQVLASEPGVFEPVRDHPATERTLVQAHRELTPVSKNALDAIARTSDRAADVVRVHRAMRARLRRDWYEEHDLLASASEAVAGTDIDGLGALVVHLPQHLTEPAARFLKTIAGRLPTTVIAALAGPAEADRAVRRSLRLLGFDTDGLEPPVHPAPVAQRVMGVSDPDEEVRAVVRLVVDARRNGVPLDRMAVLHPDPEPYARLLHEHLDAAGLPYNGTAPRRLAETVLGRTIGVLLALPDHDWQRQDVVDLLASSPLRGEGGRLVPGSAWERITRMSGVVGGAQGWAERLSNYAVDRRADAEAEGRRDGREWVQDRAGRDADRADDLREFVARLIADTTPASGSWKDRCRWVRRLVWRYLGGEQIWSEWPEIEQRAAEKVQSVLDRLQALDDVDPQPSIAVFRRTLELELDAGLGRIGRIGDGLLVGPPAAAIGLDLDRVFVVGMAEGIFPRRVRDDSLLPDRERAAAGDQLRLRASGVHDDHRHLLAAMASAPERVLLYPRGDLRQSVERMPSRWLLDSVEALLGRRVYGEELGDVDHPNVVEVASFEAGLAGSGFPASDHDYALRDLLDHDRSGHRVDDHEMVGRVPSFARGLELVRARRSDRFTRFDGNLSAVTPADPTGVDQVVSPTRLEAWADCPQRYLFRHILRIEPVELPDAQLRITPIDRGNIIHHALDRFLRSVLERPDDAQPGPADPWTESDRRELLDIALDECRGYEQRGLVGKALFWRRDRRQILRDLDLFLLADDAARSVGSRRPVASELGFGVADARRGPVDITLADGRVVRFRGSIDRVDVAGDGSLVVIDYKTGSPNRYRGLSPDDPVKRGTALQLPVYAAAARAALDAPRVEASAGYWFVTERRRYESIGYRVDSEVEEEFAATVATIVDGIAAGLFVAHPEPESSWRGGFVSCHYCNPDGLGTRDRHAEWVRKRRDPALAGYVALAEPEAVIADG